MWTTEENSETVTTVRVFYSKSSDWMFKILLSSDRHIDSIHSDHYFQRKHLNIAKTNNWPVIDLGDFFDSMQGKFDPRRSRIQRADLSNKEEYYDTLVDYGYKFLKDYKDQFAVMGIGNHETSALKHAETHLLKRLVNRLRRDNSPVILGAYSGWIRILFGTQKDGKCNGARRSVIIRYTHGGGGSAPVTKGVLKTSRRGVVFPDANIIISGHTHDTWVFPIPRERLSIAGNLKVDEQLHISLPSYKDETTGQPIGFGVEKEHAPKTKGAVWLKFWYDNNSGVKYDVERAL